MRDGDAHAAEEARLARAAASGDGSAFAELYRRYEQCVYNLAYRIVGSEADAADAVQEAFLIAMRRLGQVADRDADFGPELLAATHDVCHDLVGGGQADQPREVGSEAPQEEVREASLRLPERQREGLALRGLAQLSYEEIAAVMDMSGDSVAQLISRARINLYDELRGTVLASVAPPTPECERALPLIAAREDGQLEASSTDAAWLDSHLAGCERCRLAVDQMAEARASYDSWAPLAAVPWLLGETMAKAAELVGADWSGEIAKASSQAQDELPAVTPSAHPARRGTRRSRRRTAVVAALAALLLLASVAAAALVGDSGRPAPVEPVAGAASKKSNLVSEPESRSRKGRRSGGEAAKKRHRRSGAKTSTSSAQTAGGETTPAPFSVPAQTTTGGGAPSEPASGQNHASGKTAVQPTQPTAASKPNTKPKPAPTSTTASQPATEPPPPPPTTTPSTESPPPTEEAPKSPGRSGEAPGKPADHPSH